MLGVAGVACDVTILRFYPVLADFGQVPKIGWLGADRQVGLRTLANREAYEWIRARTPETAVIQPNPEPNYQDTFFGAYGERQTIAVGYLCGSSFGGDPQERVNRSLENSGSCCLQEWNTGSGRRVQQPANGLCDRQRYGIRPGMTHPAGSGPVHPSSAMISRASLPALRPGRANWTHAPAHGSPANSTRVSDRAVAKQPLPPPHGRRSSS